MGFPEPDGPEDPDLLLPFIDRCHHIGKDDQGSDDKDDDRNPDRKFLEMIQRLHFGLQRLFDGRHLGMGQLL